LKKYEAILTTRADKPSAENRLVISTGSAGTVWFNTVSLFPPTWNTVPTASGKTLCSDWPT
jgi:alpha-N-arabinofuranosidase